MSDVETISKDKIVTALYELEWAADAHTKLAEVAEKLRDDAPRGAMVTEFALDAMFHRGKAMGLIEAIGKVRAVAVGTETPHAKE